MKTKPFELANTGNKYFKLGIQDTDGAAHLAAHCVKKIIHDQLGCCMDISAPQIGDSTIKVFALLGIPDELSGDTMKFHGKLTEMRNNKFGDQGYYVFKNKKIPDALFLIADTEIGLRNALLTFCDRIYADKNGNILVDDFEGIHIPAFSARHIKMDAMNCGRFRAGFEYWDPSTPSGVDEFADWLASFKITDYDLLAFMRGWGATYTSGRFPSLADPQHPNVQKEFYPQLIDHLHKWGIKVWASDIYIASGYTMETGTCPDMLSTCIKPENRPVFTAGEGRFSDILRNPNSVACLSKPAAAAYYSEIVTDILERYPMLDGLDFHIGHTYPHKLCHCPECMDIEGNREALYKCFLKVYESIMKLRPDIRIKAAVTMFGDATRCIVENYRDFPNMEFFCWLRWLSDYILDSPSAPVTIGHEDGGGGLEAPVAYTTHTLDELRKYYRDFEGWIRMYVQLTKTAGLPSISWEPQLHRELDQMFFLYSELTWEPDLNWEEFARRYIIRSERRIDKKLMEAYKLRLEINFEITSWGVLIQKDLGFEKRGTKIKGILETNAVREKIEALKEIMDSMGLSEDDYKKPPVFFDLRWSLVQSLSRFLSGDILDLADFVYAPVMFKL